MITLQDIFLDLSSGEFSNLQIGDFRMDDPDSEPDPRSYRQLINHVNLGMTALHTEFLLREEELILTLDETISIYNLDYRWAVSNVAAPETPKYITDTALLPWNDNLLKIESVCDEDGVALALNDPDDDDTLYTPRWDQVQLAWPNELDATLTVKYRADHPTIVYASDIDPTTEYLELPRQLREALLFYVAARVYAGINVEKPEANDYYRKYLAKVDDNHRHGLYVTKDQDNARFSDNGWV